MDFIERPTKIRIIQKVVKKNWEIFNKTKKYPLYKDSHVSEKPPRKNIWKGQLKSGEILFIPRGYWHHATAVNEPSLHLTFTFKCQTAENYLKWIQEKLLEFDVFRKNIPTLSGLDEIEKYQKELTAAIIASLEKNRVSSFVKVRT